MQRQPHPSLIRELEIQCRLVGKRTADVPRLASFRRKYRWRFRRLADAVFVVLIWNTLAAAYSPTGLVVAFALASALINILTIHYCEARARAISRQLNRPAAEQLARDMMGLAD